MRRGLNRMAEIHAGLRFASLSVKLRWKQSRPMGLIEARFFLARLPRARAGPSRMARNRARDAFV